MQHQPIEPDIPDAPTPGQPDDPPHPPLDAPPDKPPVVKTPVTHRSHSFTHPTRIC